MLVLGMWCVPPPPNSFPTRNCLCHSYVGNCGLFHTPGSPKWKQVPTTYTESKNKHICIHFYIGTIRVGNALCNKAALTPVKLTHPLSPETAPVWAGLGGGGGGETCGHTGCQGKGWWCRFGLCNLLPIPDMLLSRLPFPHPAHMGVLLGGSGWRK